MGKLTRGYLVNAPTGDTYLASSRPLSTKQTKVLAALTEEFLEVPIIAMRAGLHSKDSPYTGSTISDCFSLVRKGYAEFVWMPSTPGTTSSRRRRMYRRVHV